MEASLQVPTATSVRTIPAKLIMDNRVVINNHLARTRGVSLNKLVEEWATVALRMVNAWTNEIPIADPILRMSVLKAAPSLRRGVGSVAKAIVARGTNIKLLPTPWTKPPLITSQSSAANERPDI